MKITVGEFLRKIIKYNFDRPVIARVYDKNRDVWYDAEISQISAFGDPSNKHGSVTLVIHKKEE